MTLVQYLFPAGPEGATLTNANAGASVTSLGTGTGVFAAAVKGNGSPFGGKYTNGLNAQTLQRFLVTESVQMATSVVLTLPTALSNSTVTMYRWRHTSGTVASINLTSDGKLTFSDSGGVITPIATAAQLTAANLLGQKVTVRAVLTGGSTTAGAVALEVRRYSDDSLLWSLNLSNANLSTNTIVGAEVGICSNTNNAGTVVGAADLQFNDGGTTQLAPLSAPVNAAPTVTVGPTQNVAAGATVNLTSTATDADGTIASRQWTFDYPTSGAPALTGANTANASFTAGPAGSLYVLRHTAVDNAGATTSATTEVRVPVTGSTDARPLPANGAAVGAWSRTGTATSDGAALADESDGTYLESPSLSATETSLRVRLQPSAARATGKVQQRLSSDVGTLTAIVRLYEGATLRQTWTQAVSTTIADYEFTLSGATIAAITDWGNLYLEVAG